MVMIKISDELSNELDKYSINLKEWKTCMCGYISNQEIKFYIDMDDSAVMELK